MFLPISPFGYGAKEGAIRQVDSKIEFNFRFENRTQVQSL
jgi:hypothetical protein